MKTAEVISVDGRQAVRLPDEFRFVEDTVSVRKEGDAVILEPVKSNTWPLGFFEAIRVDDPALVRPPQGETPPALAIESL
ncbi:MAG: AbrB/MazE/SpoVT family DNA-binding domain-containing protein [Planctomycetota bacterium]|nr:AbrB/MazE/SpoVT family DNA-binding domain-containing protein [Planctomycetota bacterium]